ncbi:hypothetical protein QR680_017827 [Steinernema hermaphroditum]|uniref:Peptidase A1 domain-containing protein n=1 Tax=Steinernema hermaphroditum TaxID=289476 RepID=A0AA39LPR0_9BILA|nr:hypothetical protein QR680_017827 [Steinernema hermaphroditum]
MLKWIVAVTLLSLCLGRSHPRGVRSVTVRRRDPEIRKGPFAHDPMDYFVMTVALEIGSGWQNCYECWQQGQFVMDTTRGELEVTTCNTAYPTLAPGYQGDLNCFDTFNSTSYVQREDKFATDTVSDVDGNPIELVKFATNKKHFGQFMGIAGFGWPAAQNNPLQTDYFPDVFFGKLSKRFQLKLDADAHFMTGSFTNRNVDICELSDLPTVNAPVSSKRYWQFAFTSVSIGDIGWNTGDHMVIDTRKEYIGMPKRLLTTFASAHNVTWDGLYGVYTLECEKVKTLPALEISLDRLATLSIPASEYFYMDRPLPNGRCALDFEDSKANGFGPSWYIGLHIFTQYCTTFDFEAAQLSFTVMPPPQAL